MAVPATVTDPGNCMAYAHYNIVRSDGADVGGDGWTSPGTQNQSLYATVDGPGSYTLAGDGGYDVGYDDLTATDSNVLVAKLGSKAKWVKATRKKTKLTVTASVTKFDGGYAFQGWATTVLLQKQAGDSWVTVASKKANSKGAATLTVKKPKGVYRIATADTDTVWGAATSGHTK